MQVSLSRQEMDALFDSALTEGQGGFQELVMELRRKTDRETGRLTLDDADLEKIGRYAFSYGGGGWQDALLRVFSRTLGPDLAGE